MYLDNIPLDITKSAAEIIFDKINAVNGLQLPASEFVLGEPEVYSGAQYSLANTKLVISPKVTSAFYNNFTIYYSRMSIVDIFDNPYISIARGAGDDISDILPDINAAYGINLTTDDYYDGPLPPVDPLDPDAELLVMFTCRPESILFYGQQVITLNKVVPAPTLPSLDTADIYIVVEQPLDAVFKDTIVCRSSAGDVVSNFVFMRNCSAVNEVEITHIQEIKYLGLIVFGNFDFDADLNDGAGDVNHVTNCIVLSSAGRVISDANDQFGADNINDLVLIKDTQKKYIYYIDPTNKLGSETSKVYRYLETGVIDNGFSLPSANAYGYACVDVAGNIYAATSAFTVTEDHDSDPLTPNFPVPQIWIDKYLENGAVSTGFTRIKIRASNFADPWDLACIEPIEGDQSTTTTGVYYALVPEQAVAAGSLRSPVVNSIRLAGADQAASYGFLPIFKTSLSGVLDTNFVTVKSKFAPEGIYDFDNAPQPYATGSEFITAVADDVVMLTYRANPITGVKQYMPVKYDRTGVMKKISGDEYEISYRWEEVSTMMSIANNSIVVVGQCSLPDGAGGFKTAAPTVACYDKNTQVQAVIYESVNYPTDIGEIKQVLIRDGR